MVAPKHIYIYVSSSMKLPSSAGGGRVQIDTSTGHGGLLSIFVFYVSSAISDLECVSPTRLSSTRLPALARYRPVNHGWPAPLLMRIQYFTCQLTRSIPSRIQLVDDHMLQPIEIPEFSSTSIRALVCLHAHCQFGPDSAIFAYYMCILQCA